MLAVKVRMDTVESGMPSLISLHQINMLCCRVCVN